MMKTMTSLVCALGLVAFAGCSKKKEEGTAQKPMEGSANVQKPAEGSAGSATAQTPVKPMTGAEMAEKYKTCVSLIGASKFDDFIKDCVAETYAFHDRATGMEGSGSKMIKEFFEMQKAAFSDWKFEPQLVLVNGRNIFGVLLSTGTHDGTMKSPMGDVPATKKKHGFLMLHRLAINEQNKATEEWGYMDPGNLMGQLGLTPPGAPPSRPAMTTGLPGAPIVAVAADDAKEKANLELVTKEVAAINDRKWADAWAMYAPDAVLSVQSMAADIKGVKEMEKDAKPMFEAFPDAKIVIDNSWAAGDYVVTMGKFTGTHQKDLGPIKKTGKSLALDFAEVFQIKDGKIANVWRFYSSMQFMQQLGLMPAAAAPPAGGAAPAGAPAGAPPAGGAPAAGSAAAPAGAAAPDKK